MSVTKGPLSEGRRVVCEVGVQTLPVTVVTVVAESRLQQVREYMVKRKRQESRQLKKNKKKKNRVGNLGKDFFQQEAKKHRMWQVEETPLRCE